MAVTQATRLLRDASIARITWAGDRAVADTHVGPARSLLQNLIARLRLGGTCVGRDRRTMPDGTRIEVRVAGSANHIHIDTAAVSDDVTLRLTREVHDLVSGVFVDPGVDNAYGMLEGPFTFYPDAATAQAYPDQAEDWAAAGRFSVRLGEALGSSGFLPASRQYGALRPGMFSGRMVDVVQAALAFGQFHSPSLFRPSWSETVPERQRGRTRDKMRREHELDFGVSEAERQDRESEFSGRQVQYMPTQSRTHGITVAEDGRYWVVEISEDGVRAMPLPLDRGSTTPEFRAYLEGQAGGDGDGAGIAQQALDMVDEFGGFPTGEGFPEDEALTLYENAGLVIELASRYELYSLYHDWNSMGEACGWAFSRSGAKADVIRASATDSGLLKLAHFSLSIQISASASGQVDEDGAALQAIVRDADSVPLWKRRLAYDKIPFATTQIGSWLSLAENSGAAALIDEMLDYDTGGFAFGSASLSEVESGTVTASTRVGYNPPRFLHPSYAGMSQTYAPLAQASDDEDYKGASFDLPFFVYYEGETARTTRIAGGADSEVQSDAPDSGLSFPGTQVVTETQTLSDPVIYQSGGNSSGNSRVFARKATFVGRNISDGREELGRPTKNGTYYYVWQGQTNIENEAFTDYSVNYGLFTRTVAIAVDTEIEQSGGKEKRFYAVAPLGCRESVYIGDEDVDPGYVTKKDTWYQDIMDSTAYLTVIPESGIAVDQITLNTISGSPSRFVELGFLESDHVETINKGEFDYFQIFEDPITVTLNPPGGPWAQMYDNDPSLDDVSRWINGAQYDTTIYEDNPNLDNYPLDEIDPRGTSGSADFDLSVRLRFLVRGSTKLLGSGSVESNSGISYYNKGGETAMGAAFSALGDSGALIYDGALDGRASAAVVAGVAKEAGMHGKSTTFIGYV